MAPMIRKGSLPKATEAGRGAKGESWERSSWQAKKRRKGRRCWVTWSRMVPCRTGYRDSRASRMERTVTGPSISSEISPGTWARVRRCAGRMTCIGNDYLQRLSQPGFDPIGRDLFRRDGTLAFLCSYVSLRPVSYL